MKKFYSIIFISLLSINSYGQSKKELISTIERMKNDSIYLRNLINKKNDINEIARKEIDKKNNEILKINNSLNKQILLSSNFKVTISNQKKLLDSLNSKINELNKKIISSKNLFSSYSEEDCVQYETYSVEQCYEDTFYVKDGIYKSYYHYEEIDSNGDSIVEIFTLKTFLDGYPAGSWLTFKNNQIVRITFNEGLSAEIYKNGNIKSLSYLEYDLGQSRAYEGKNGKIFYYDKNGALLKEEIIEFGEVIECTGKCN